MILQKEKTSMIIIYYYDTYNNLNLLIS